MSSFGIRSYGTEMRTVRKTLNDFSLWTNAGGIPNLGRSRSICMRLFWAVIFAVCFALCVYQTAFQVKKYLSFPFTVHTDIEIQTLSFPAVTLCHLNPYKLSAVLANEQLREFVKGFNKAMENRLEPREDKWGFLEGNQRMGKQAVARNSLTFYVSTLSEESRRNISYEWTDMIRTCSYDRSPCKDGFKTTFYPSYGNCFTFNWNLSIRSFKSGPAYGLRLLLVTDLEEYLPFTEAAGVRVIVAGKGGHIYPDSSGCNAGTGFASSLTVHYTESKRLGPPYSKCMHYSSGYSVERCTRQCMQNYIHSQCGCSSPQFDIVNGSRYCNLSSAKCITNSVATFRHSLENFEATVAYCNCHPPCQESTYKLTASTATWPSRFHKAVRCSNSTRGRQACREWYKKNTLLLEIFYERMNYQLIKETETYTLSSLISDFGGNMGLWIGFSVITVVEFLFLPAMLISKCLRQRRSKEALTALGAVEIDYSDDRDNEFDKIGGDNDPPPPYGGQPFDLSKYAGISIKGRSNSRKGGVYLKTEEEGGAGKEMEKETRDTTQYSLTHILINAPVPDLI